MRKNVLSLLNSNKRVKGFARGHMETKLDKFISDLDIIFKAKKNGKFNLN